MADNYLEKSYEDYKARQAAKQKAKEADWQKRLKTYRQRLQSSPDKPK